MIEQRPPPIAFDPSSAAAFENPASMFVAARAEQPVFFAPALGGWVITRRDDIERVIEDFRGFSNSIVGQIPVPEAFAAEFPPDLFARSLLALDPPEHSATRKIAQRGFRRPRVDQLAPIIETTAHRLIDGFAGAGGCDLMRDYALALTARTIAGLLGLNDESVPFLLQLRHDHLAVLTSFGQPMREPERTQVWARYAAAHRRFRELVDMRIECPGDDIVSAMAIARDVDGAPALSREQIALHLCEFAMAGIDTTANLIANAVVLLSSEPERLAELVLAPDFWPAAVEETLRIHPSTIWMPRIATQDTEIGGIAIAAGQMVWLALASASHDSRFYANPEIFDLHRPAREDHLAFGKGRHFCLGAPLARLQARIALSALYQRLPDVRPVAGRAPEFNNLAALPLRIGLKVSWGAASALAGQRELT